VRGPPQCGQEGVSHRDDAKNIGLVSATEAVDVRGGGRIAVDHDAGVVDQDVQILDLPGGGGDAAAVGHVKQEQTRAAADLADRALPRSWSRQPACTVSPAVASCLAISRPMPFEAPVTSAQGYVMDR
jgi:hypothetical protein